MAWLGTNFLSPTGHWWWGHWYGCWALGPCHPTGFHCSRLLHMCGGLGCCGGQMWSELRGVMVGKWMMAA